MFNQTISTTKELIANPSYRRYLLRRAATVFGYEQEHLARYIYTREWRDFMTSLPLGSLCVLEISPGPRPVIDKSRTLRYRAVHYPEFDICGSCLPETFDIVIAEQVFEHLRHPYRAARNIRRMLNDGGIFLIATPFLLRVHGVPFDYTRWTPDGLKAFLEDCGFSADVRFWGNRKAVRANFRTWRAYGWGHDLTNEPDFPVCVWAYARKQ